MPVACFLNYIVTLKRNRVTNFKKLLETIKHDILVKDLSDQSCFCIILSFLQPLKEENLAKGKEP